MAGIDLQNANHEEAVQAIKSAPSPVEFIVQSLSSTPRVLLMSISPPTVLAAYSQIIIFIYTNDILLIVADDLNHFEF